MSNAAPARRGLLDALLLLPLAYALYAMTPIGALAETALRVARGQADRPDWFSTFRGRETDVALAHGPSTTAPSIDGPVPTALESALRGREAAIVPIVHALVAAQGGCMDAVCTVRAPPRAADFWPAVAGRETLSAVGIVGLVERAHARLASRGARAPELVLEALAIGMDATERAVTQAERSGISGADDVEKHAAFIAPALRRGALQAALVAIVDLRLRSLAWPAAAHFRVTSPFGDRVHPVTGEPKFHNGTDVGVPVGTPLYAAYRGAVERRGEDSVSGNYLVLDYGLGLQSVLCHLSEPLVATHDDVNRAQQVALSGDTGRVTGPHLHYILRLRGTPVDAERYRASP